MAENTIPSVLPWRVENTNEGTAGVPRSLCLINIWNGVLEWKGRIRGSDGQRKTIEIQGHVFSEIVDGEPQVKGETWPPKLIMHLVAKGITAKMDAEYMHNATNVLFNLQEGHALACLNRDLAPGLMGCIQIINSNSQAKCPVRLLFLFYNKDRNTYQGFIPNDQAGCIYRLKTVIAEERKQLEMRKQAQMQGPAFPMGQPGVGGPTGSNLSQGPLPPQPNVSGWSLPHGFLQGGMQTHVSHYPIPQTTPSTSAHFTALEQGNLSDGVPGRVQQLSSDNTSHSSLTHEEWDDLTNVFGNIAL